MIGGFMLSVIFCNVDPILDMEKNSSANFQFDCPFYFCSEIESYRNQVSQFAKMVTILKQRKMWRIS